MAKLAITPQHIRDHLFLGGFRPMTEQEQAAFLGAEPTTVISELRIGKVSAIVLFDPCSGDCDLYYAADEHNPSGPAFRVDLFYNTMTEI